MIGSLLVVELAGPAGAGKTTIRNALSKPNGTIKFVPLPHIRDPRNLPFFLWNAILLLPVFFALCRDRKEKSLTFPFIVRLAILNGWSKKLNVLRSMGRSVLILDQGPVYLLAELLRHGPPDFRSTAPTWWEQVCQDWVNTLDMVICLEAPDAVLVQRNRTRDKNHGIKQNTDDWAAEFLAQSRKAQTAVLSSMMERPGRMTVVPIETSRSSLDELVQRISCLFEDGKKTR